MSAMDALRTERNTALAKVRDSERQRTVDAIRVVEIPSLFKVCPTVKKYSN
jgi:hypothetical protein